MRPRPSRAAWPPSASGISFTVSQFMIEIRMLAQTHRCAGKRRIHRHAHPSSSTAPGDGGAHPRRASTLPVAVGARRRLPYSRSPHFGCAVAEELTGAMIRRLRNALPTASGDSAMERDSGFAGDARSERAGGGATGQAHLRSTLSGSYACMKDGKAVRPPFQPSAACWNRRPATPRRLLRQAEEFLDGALGCSTSATRDPRRSPTRWRPTSAGWRTSGSAAAIR